MQASAASVSHRHTRGWSPRLASRWAQFRLPRFVGHCPQRVGNDDRHCRCWQAPARFCLGRPTTHSRIYGPSACKSALGSRLWLWAGTVPAGQNGPTDGHSRSKRAREGLVATRGRQQVAAQGV